MALPGTPGQRISDLCNGNKIKQKRTCREDRRFRFPVEPHCQRRNKDSQQRYSHRCGKGI